MDLRDRVALITGSSRGLGFVLAQAFAREGARIVLCARNGDTLEHAREHIERLGADVMAIPCDVTDRQQVERLVAQATARFGHIDVLVNNAGIITMGPLHTQTLDDFAASMDTMFWGPVYATLAVLPQMLARRRGRIVNVTSIGGRVSAPHLLPYCSAKFAAAGFSEGLRAELGRYGIAVTTVVPGFMRTGSYLNAAFKGRHRAEFTWFSLLGSLPLTSMDAREAARQIVRATQRGDADLVLSVPAQLATRFHGLLPGLTADLSALVSRLLPTPDGDRSQSRLGWDSQSRLSDSFLTTWGERAARAYLQDLPHGAQAPGEDRPAPAGRPREPSSST